MILVLDRQTPSLPVGQLVRILPTTENETARISTIRKVLHRQPGRRYYMDQTWVPDEKGYSDKDLEPVIELFFHPVDESDRSRGYEVVVRNGPLRVLGVVVAESRGWRAKPEGSGGFLPSSFRTRKSAALELIQRRRRGTRSPDL
jgi:hypothetical protein